MESIVANPSREREVAVLSGWVMLGVVVVLIVAAPVLFISAALGVDALASGADVVVRPLWLFLAGAASLVAAVVSLFGFFTLEPNQARVLVLFGRYRGTVRRDGFHWGNPFYSNGPSIPFSLAVSKKPGELGLSLPRRRRMKISLRARNLNGERLKVNDKQGNPIEIGAVVVWRVADTAQAMFDVDDYEEYVRVQSESAVRQLCSQYAYDHGEAAEVTLRSGVDEVSQALTRELEQRLAKAGVRVEEARLTHLAYSPEIAQAMLRRQQAEAVLAARRKIVEGAVGMVRHAIDELGRDGGFELDPERRAAMAGNLLVVLCGETEARPVINAGTLY